MGIDVLPHWNHVVEPITVINFRAIPVNDILVQALFEKRFFYHLDLVVSHIHIWLFRLERAIKAIRHAALLCHWLWAHRAFKRHNSWSKQNVRSEWLSVLSKVPDLICWQIKYWRVPKFILNSIVGVWKRKVHLDIHKPIFSNFITPHVCKRFFKLPFYQISIVSENPKVRDSQLVSDPGFLMLLISRLPQHLKIFTNIVINDHSCFEPVILRIHSLWHMGTGSVVKQNYWESCHHSLAVFPWVLVYFSLEVTVIESRTSFAVGPWVIKFTHEILAIWDMAIIADEGLDFSFAAPFVNKVFQRIRGKNFQTGGSQLLNT